MKTRGEVKKLLAYFISFSQKVHMIALNSIAIDLIPYTLITLFHTRDMPLQIILPSGIFLALLIYDYCEIWFKGGRSIVPEFKNDKHKYFLGDSSVLDLNKVKTGALGKELKDKIPSIPERQIDH